MGVIRFQRPPGPLVTGAVLAGVAALLDVQREGDDGAEDDERGDGQVHAEVMVAEHGPGSGCSGLSHRTDGALWHDLRPAAVRIAVSLTLVRGDAHARPR